MLDCRPLRMVDGQARPDEVAAAKLCRRLHALGISHFHYDPLAAIAAAEAKAKEVEA